MKRNTLSSLKRDSLTRLHSSRDFLYTRRGGEEAEEEEEEEEEEEKEEKEGEWTGGKMD